MQDKKLEDYSKEELISIIKSIKKQKKFGLVWEDKPEKVATDCKEKLPVLNEDASKAISKAPGQPTNIIIEGDNYHSLSALNYTHSGKIDVIYIDPPYNTGNKDFKYNDRYVDKEDAFKHSKWLSFMRKRLELAKNLLKTDGVLFISIDDNEQAYLKLLCDEIFGENNFASSLHVEMSLTQGMKVGAAQNGSIVKNGEYVLVYAKDIQSFKVKHILYDGVDGYDSHFSLYIKENNGEYVMTTIGDFLAKSTELDEYFKKYSLRKSFPSFRRLMEIDENFRALIYEKYASDFYRSMMAQIVVPEEVNQKLAAGKIVKYDKYLLHQTSSGKMAQLLSLSSTIGDTDDYEPKYGRRRIRGDMWKGFYSDMMNLAKEGGIEFKNGKKPVRLVKQLCKWGSSNNGIILDFFAGSGTTGQAVLELNKEEKSNRRFIICTNNENEIAETITLPRIKNVVDGYNNIDGIPANVRYFRTGFIEKEETVDKLRRKLSPACEDMIRIREGVFNKTIDDDLFKVFEENGQIVGVIYDRFELEKYIDQIEELETDKPVHLYVFSYDNSGRLDEVTKTTKHEYESQPIPEGVLEIYKKIFKDRRH